MPGGHSTVAGDVDALFYFIFYASLILMAIVTFTIVYFVIRYRRRGKPGLTSGPTENKALEITWTVIPTILVFIIFAWGFKDYLRLHIVPANSMEVKVTAQQWFWSFQYPDGATNVNELVVPVDKPVKLLMSSKDVIHSFYVPSFRIKQDVLPNRYTIEWFQATDTGSYNLFCAEYCGEKHSSMIGKVKVVTQPEYEEWLQTAQGPSGGQSPAEYGEQLYHSKACVTCHSINGTPGTGPSFLNKFGSMETLEGGEKVLIDENYVRESILKPRAKVVKGFQPVMPTFQGLLNDKQIDAIVAFLKSIGKNPPPEQSQEKGESGSSQSKTSDTTGQTSKNK